MENLTTSFSTSSPSLLGLSSSLPTSSLAPCLPIFFPRSSPSVFISFNHFLFSRSPYLAPSPSSSFTSSSASSSSSSSSTTTTTTTTVLARLLFSRTYTNTLLPPCPRYHVSSFLLAVPLTLSYSPSRFGGFRPACCRLIYESHASNLVAHHGAQRTTCVSLLSTSSIPSAHSSFSLFLLLLRPFSRFSSRALCHSYFMDTVWRIESSAECPTRRSLILISIDTS